VDEYTVRSHQVHTIISAAIIEFGNIARFLVKILKHQVMLPVTSSMPVTTTTVKTPMLTPQVGRWRQLLNCGVSYVKLELSP